MDNNKKKIPTLFLVLRIVGFGLIAAGITLLILAIATKVPEMGQNGWFEAEEKKSLLMFGGITCLIFSVPMLVTGFMSKIQKSFSKVSIQTTSEIIEENKEDLKNISNTTAEIQREAITTKAKAVKDGLKDTIYCKHCGAEIDSDSTFCKECGKKQ